jgi:MFS family permease
MKLSRTRVLLICTLAAFFYLYEFLVRVIPSAMLQPMMAHFDIGIATAGWLSGAFFFGYVPMQIPSGLLLDSFGGRKILAFATLLCALSCAAFAYVNSVPLALLLRFIMGLTGSVAFTGALYVASGWIPRRLFGFYSGLVQTLGCVGAILGQAPVSALQRSIGYTQTQLGIGLVGVIFAVLIFVIVRDPADTGADDKEVLHSDSHLLRRFVGVIKNKQNLVIGLYVFLTWAPINIVASLWGIPFLMHRFALSAQQAGLYMAVAWAGIAISSPIVAQYSSKSKDRMFSMLLCVAVGLISSCVMIYSSQLSLPVLAICLFLFGCQAAGQPIAFDLAYSNNASSSLGTALGFTNMSAIAGGMLLQPLVGILIAAHAGHHMLRLRDYSLSDFHFALAIVPACMLLNVFVIVFMLDKNMRKNK